MIVGLSYSTKKGEEFQLFFFDFKLYKSKLPFEMVKSLIGFVVLVLGGCLGYFAKSMVTIDEGPQVNSIQIEPIEFMVSGDGLSRPGGGGSCGS